jgi:hypothetical protein
MKYFVNRSQGEVFVCSVCCEGHYCFRCQKFLLFQAPKIFATDTKIWLLNDTHVLLRNVALSICKPKRFMLNSQFHPFYTYLSTECLRSRVRYTKLCPYYFTFLYITPLAVFIIWCFLIKTNLWICGLDRVLFKSQLL